MVNEKKSQSSKNKKSQQRSEAKVISSGEYRQAIEALRDSLARSSSNISKLADIQFTAPKFDSEFLETLRGNQESISRIRLRTEISELESQLQRRIEQLQKDLASNKRKAKEVDELRNTIEALTHKREIQHLLDSVSVKAHEILEENEEFRGRFASNEEVSAFVVSVDIRRSTELMLKARSPKQFADFITILCHDLEQIFKDNWAVVDKFTGDGILAFFPEFFSGPDAGYLALKSAQQANDAFDRRYREFRSSFSSVLKQVGLGTGIDYGEVYLARMAGALTIVGQPVVYACRLGAAPASRILLNQPAFEVINEHYPHITTIEEVDIEIKSEGSLICYDAQLTDKDFCAKKPNWIEESSSE